MDTPLMCYSVTVSVNQQLTATNKIK